MSTPTPDPYLPDGYALPDFEAFVAAHPWKFAKTMPQVPHHYVVRENVDSDGFSAAVQFVRKHGYQAVWGRRTFVYFDHEGYRYWSMGAPMERTIILNRARIGDPGTPERATE